VAPVTFDTVFALFQSYGCSDTGCHGGNKPAEGLNLSSKTTAQANLVGVTSDQCTTKKLVVAGEPTQSYLINKLTGVGMCSGSQMPKGGAAVTAAELDKIRAWISGL
jgi:hypothetical protein